MMKTKLTSSLLLFMFAFFCMFSINAQPQYYNFNTYGSTNSYPLNQTAGKQVQWIYLAGDFNQPTPAVAGTITSISFLIGDNLGPWTYTNFVIKMGQTTDIVLPAGSFYTSTLNEVYNRGSIVLSGLTGQWMTITLDNPFIYDPTKSLIIDVQQCGVAGATGFSLTQTTFSGNRRSWSIGGCPFVYDGQGSEVAHIGLNITPTPLAAVPVSLWSVAVGLLMIFAFTYYRLRKRNIA
jgi:hypothetical protein